VVGLVVFTRNPELEVDECGFAALPLDELKETIRGIQFELGGERGESAVITRILTSEDRRRISALIAPASTPVATKPIAVAKRGAEKA
jgi:hypothetical protein